MQFIFVVQSVRFLVASKVMRPHFVAMSPRLTHSGRALLPQMADKARGIIEGACSPKADKDAFMSDLGKADASCRSFEEFAAKIIGVAVSPTMDPSDQALYDVMSALESAGMYSVDEMRLMETLTPKVRDNWGAHYPREIRAQSFAKFYNGRNQEGTLGENLPHIAIRRAWERLYETFSGLSALANRMGFYSAGDLFLPAYQGRAIRELSPTGPGEIIPPGTNDNKRN